MDEPDPAREWLAKVRSRGPGWLDAFGELVRLHEGWVRAYLRTRMRDWSAADDLAQEVFVTAFRRIRTYEGDGSFEGWLRGIAHNHWRNHLRKRRESPIGGYEEIQIMLEAGADPFRPAGDDHRALDALRECLMHVDGPSRDLLQQRYSKGLSVREISASCGRGYSALTMQLHRLRESLAECIRRKLEAIES
ncbi:MAG: sigma-70 family RNA polymerase sigma factor [Akkermansiaceae bacterium]|jgi:RNA polymerase sigma-70 factor (ECF subfamily)|nr:sigma-70 family RNA polymerase sigma factor [Akkermansiaceae bacterium]